MFVLDTPLSIGQFDCPCLVDFPVGDVFHSGDICAHFFAGLVWFTKLFWWCWHQISANRSCYRIKRACEHLVLMLVMMLMP